jgi:hypothetical protein
MIIYSIKKRCCLLVTSLFLLTNGCFFNGNNVSIMFVPLPSKHLLSAGRKSSLLTEKRKLLVSPDWKMYFSKERTLFPFFLKVNLDRARSYSKTLSSPQSPGLFSSSRRSQVYSTSFHFCFKK